MDRTPQHGDPSYSSACSDSTGARSQLERALLSFCPWESSAAACPCPWKSTANTNHLPRESIWLQERAWKIKVLRTQEWEEDLWPIRVWKSLSLKNHSSGSSFAPVPAYENVVKHGNYCGDTIDKGPEFPECTADTLHYREFTLWAGFIKGTSEPKKLGQLSLSLFWLKTVKKHQHESCIVFCASLYYWQQQL